MIQFILEVKITLRIITFQPIQIYFKSIVNVGNDKYVYYWKSNGLSDEPINPIKTSDCGITPCLSYYDGNEIRVKFDGERPRRAFSWRNSIYLHCL